jgi:predicted transcriptional regulator of viral defense system
MASLQIKPASALDTLRQLALTRPLFRRAEALATGVNAMALTRLERAGAIMRTGRGLYCLRDGPGHIMPGLMEAVLQVPKGVVCLLSALAFHQIGTQQPREIWMMIPHNCPTPKVHWPPLRIIRSRVPESFTLGVETHLLDGVPVKVTDPDRTIVDCFKHRNHVTLDACFEALHERKRKRPGWVNGLARYTKPLHMENVMRQYTEVLAWNAW